MLAKKGDREIVKRIESIKGDDIYVVGDNRHESTDSRHYGSLNKNAILGVIMLTLPSAVNPPKPVMRSAIWLGRIAALLLVIMALVHLFRIDTFIPLLDDVLPGGSVAASFAALTIILSEMFAVPFALRIKLSPVGHILSGFLMVFAPLCWSMIALWSLGFTDNIAQLGEFMIVPASLLVLALNLSWLIYSLFTLHALGYASLKVPSTAVLLAKQPRTKK